MSVMQQDSTEHEEVVEDRLQDIARAVEEISHGNCKDGALGLEAVVMALGGSGSPGHEGGIKRSLDAIAEAINNLAAAVREHDNARPRS